MSEPDMTTNETRAEWAATALDLYATTKEGRPDYDEPEHIAGDLICDLLHLIRAHGGDPLAKLWLAQINFEDEEYEQKPHPRLGAKMTDGPGVA